jgi:hypothetical protein
VTFPGICFGVSAVPVVVPAGVPAADADTSVPGDVLAGAGADTSVPVVVLAVHACTADVLRPQAAFDIAIVFGI